MSGAFYGTLQKVEVTADLLSIRCVREFFHSDGLMADDVWTWLIKNPEAGKGERLQLLEGKTVDSFEIREGVSGQVLRMSVDEETEPFSVAGTAVEKSEEPRDTCDLKDVIAQLCKQIERGEAGYLALNRKISGVTTFVEQKIDRIQRRAEFEQQRVSGKSDGLSREIEDLQTILRKLKERS